MAKIVEAGTQIDIKPKKESLNKLEKDIENVVKKAFTSALKGTGSVTRIISSAIQGAFRINENITGFFQQIVEMTKASSDMVKETVELASSIEDNAKSLGMGNQQYQFLERFASLSGITPEDLTLAVNKFQDARDNGILAKYGINQKDLGGKQSGEGNQFLRFMQILGNQKNGKIKNQLVKNVFGSEDNEHMANIYNLTQKEIMDRVEKTRESRNKNGFATDTAIENSKTLRQKMIEANSINRSTQVNYMKDVPQKQTMSIYNQEEQLRLKPLDNMRENLSTYDNILNIQNTVSDEVRTMAKLINEGIKKLGDMFGYISNLLGNNTNFSDTIKQIHQKDLENAKKGQGMDAISGLVGMNGSIQ